MSLTHSARSAQRVGVAGVAGVAGAPGGGPWRPWSPVTVAALGNTEVSDEMEALALAMLDALTEP